MLTSVLQTKTSATKPFFSASICNALPFSSELNLRSLLSDITPSSFSADAQHARSAIKCVCLFAYAPAACMRLYACIALSPSHCST
ncbi:hypothetical protein GOP47_0025369 [Adiantum capillus-veneris]|uniref:Uncharacterized protein n=1 Tax=Adiantum capillus-veneris TaxID=13818 RepID=A0A9D4Z2X1_ADICA|nr:hypothetical protein GOP47_0025369 [Adiantum capillus-veneris]